MVEKSVFRPSISLFMAVCVEKNGRASSRAGPVFDEFKHLAGRQGIVGHVGRTLSTGWVLDRVQPGIVQDSRI